jgi:Family of unknown function (DUF6174)
MKRSRVPVSVIAIVAVSCTAQAATPLHGSGVSLAMTGGSRSDAVDPGIADGTEQRRLDRARARWDRYDVRGYRFRVALRCFCPREVTAPAVIRVRHGRPRAAPSHLRKAATVPRLLRIVQHAIDDRVSGLNVRYGRHGVPRSIGIDSRREIADDEHEYVVERFWPPERGLAGV